MQESGAPESRSIGLVVVHGVGAQRPGETVTALGRSLTSHPAAGSLHGLLAGRRPAPEAGLAAADPDMRLALEARAPGRRVSVRLYEAFWADLAAAYTPWNLVRYRLWLLWTLVYPLGNLLCRRYRPRRLSVAAFIASFLGLAVGGVLAHLSDLALRLGAWALRLAGLERKVNRAILEYGADIFTYVSLRNSRQRILARFRDAFSRAAAANTEVQVIGHSLGSVIAYDALTGGVLGAEQMARLSVLHTWGSPLDKFYFVWPARLRFGLDPPPPGPVRWINWSHRRDPIGARLGFFESVAGLGPPENRSLAGPGSPASAHTEYWSRPEVIRSLLQALGLDAAPP